MSVETFNANDATAPDDRVRFHTSENINDRTTNDEASASFAEDVRRGLSAAEKHLPPKYFYDALGSQLFEAITLLPEYYLTQAENEIFASHHTAIIGKLKDDKPLAVDGEAEDENIVGTLVELGSGSAQKTARLIEALLERQKSLTYVPVDISHTALRASAERLLQMFPALRVEAFASDYEHALERLRESKRTRAGRTLVLFLGSNIGNMEESEAQEFLRRLRDSLDADDFVLIGADLKKDAAVLEAAYDDRLGVTAAFNLNLLVRINRELDADFDVRNFRHVAFYNEARGRVELYIESLCEQAVRIAALDLEISFRQSERVHTEYSHKYAVEDLAEIGARANFELRHTWYDARRLFSSSLFRAV